MADVVPGLVEDAEGNRFAFNGWDWVPVGRDFDPAEPAFMAGLRASTEAIGAGINQLVAGIRGDDEALEALAREQGQTDAEMSVLRQGSPVTSFLGQAAPYVAGAAAGGLGASALGAGALGVGAAATAADVALAGASYGSPGERAFNMALAAGIPAAGAGLGRAVQGAARAAGIGRQGGRLPEPTLTPGAGAGGSIQGGNVADQTLAARLAGRLLGLGRFDIDVDELARTARARELAKQYDIRLSPAMNTGSRNMKMAEDALASNPYSAAPGLRVRQGMLNAVDREIRDFFLPEWEGPLDEDFLAAVRQQQSRGFEQVREQTAGNVPTMDIAERAQELAAPSQASWIRGGKEWKRFNDAMETLNEQGSQISSDVAWQLNQQWRERAADLLDSGTTRQEGIALQAMADAIEETLINAPGSQVDRQALNVLRKQYRAMEALRKARAFDGIDGLKLGVARNALAREFREMAEGTGFPDAPELRGLERVFDVFRVYQDLFRDSVGNSGTATRLALNDISPSGMGRNFVRGVAASLYYGEPQLGAAAAAPLAGAAGLAGVAGVGGATALE